MHHTHHKKSTFFVSGVCCAAEESIVRKRLDTLIGTDRYTFNPITCELSIFGDIESGDIAKHMGDAGFGVRTKQELEQEEPFWQKHAEALFIGAAAMFAVAGIAAEQFSVSLVASHALFVGAIFVGGWRVFRKAWKSLKTLTLEMNVLMTIAVVGALLIGKWSEGAAVIVLFSLSLMFESYSSSRSRRAIQSLMAISPDQASLLGGGTEKPVPARDVSVGETIVVRPGERIALDGIVIQGSSFVDQSPITGESTRVVKEVGAAVFAGSINERGSIQVRVTRRFEDTTLARIIHLVEEAQLKRAPVQTFVEMFARVYTPMVLGTAVLVAVLPPLLFHAAFLDWLYRALVLLVIACPCALVISTPVAIVSAITKAARSGVLIKGGRHIETLSKVRAIAFDKTGTMTEGKPRVTDIIPLDSLAKEEILRLAAALEHRSEHHLATAVLAEAARLSLKYSDVTVEAFEAIPGMGVSATIAGTTYHLGNHQMCEQRGFCSTAVEETLEKLSHEGKTAIVLGRNTEALAVLAIRDVARHDSTRAIKRLKALGIQHTVLLSGDENATAQRLAREVGIDRCDAGLLPEQKVSAVEKLKEKYGTVAMVGDGVNDAPALAAASVGIAMGVSGTDAALETADVVLMADDLSKLPGLVALSRKTLSIIRQNIAIALSLKLLFLILSVAGFSTLWMAVLADDGAALAVIFNGLRLLSFKHTVS